MRLSTDAPARRRKMRLARLLTTVVLVTAAVYVLLCAAAYLFQDCIVFPRPKAEASDTAAAAVIDGAETVGLSMKDGTRLNGWIVKNAPGEKTPLLIYFSANAEEVSRLIPKVSLLKGYTVVLINYRGYGDSEGIPVEKELLSDALEIYDSFSSRDDIDRDAVSVMGRSIGTGVATYLAAHRPVASVILVSPYDTMLNVVRAHFPFLPVELIFKYRFDSLSLAPSIQAPLHVIVGSKDSLIPKRHSQKLADEWGGPVGIEEIAGADHNTVDDKAEYWDLVERFLNQE